MLHNNIFNLFEGAIVQVLFPILTVVHLEGICSVDLLAAQ